MSFGVSFIGVAIGPLPFGLIYDATGSYDPAIWGLVVLPVLTTWAALTARSPGTITSRT
jgi:cyanate permease